MDTQTLKDCGASLENLRYFGKEDAGLLPYATLENARQQRDSELLALSGVYEWQGNPLIFLIDGDQLSGDEHFQHIRRMVAMRGDASYLGVVRPGQLTVHRLALDKASFEQSQIEIDAQQPQLVFSRLMNQRPGLAFAKQTWISEVVLKLLREAIGNLAATGLSNENAISLAGRALFTRFLADRQLLTSPLPCNAIDPAHLFDTPQCIAATSEWLDKTFNGDFLPLPSKALKDLAPDACKTLTHIMYRAPAGQLYLDWQEDWAHLDFAHIPVGVLSQAYEQYMRDHLSEKQRKEGSYYTPRPIVELMTSGAFHALRREGKSHAAKVLDPAVGAGVFLISAFRRLVAERWENDDKRPDTQTLREILYKQITGFDINEEALRFAALGLYLISIELDPHPEPVEKLRFETLRDRVLFKFAGGDPERPLGSLGPAVGAEHVGSYDLVIGNPPWPTGTKLPQWDEVKKIVTRIAKERLPEGTPPPPLPNEGLDLPFVWRAMEWARPGGQIAFALHARLLFQRGEGTPEARRAVFSALDVTGIVNGAELRSTKIWPGVFAPFCLLFAKNQAPAPGAGFRFVTPHIEKTLNDAGILRIDASNAEIVTVQQIIERPEIFKILFRGTTLDIEIFERVVLKSTSTIKSYWKSLFGTYRGRLKQAGKGYQRLRNSTKKPEKADHLQGLPELVVSSLSLLVDTKSLPSFAQAQLHRARDSDIYKKPILIIHKSPPVESGRVRVAIAKNDLIYNESYYGYSTAGYSEPLLLAQYLALIIGSRPAFWYILMSSGEFGFEREVVEKIIIDNIPIIPLENINALTKAKIVPLFNALAKNNTEDNWEKVDTWAAELFGLNQRDLQVISNTLEYNLPFSANKKAAQAPVTSEKSTEFCKALEAELAPWAKRAKTNITINPVKKLPATSPWKLLRLDTQHASAQALDDWPEILRTADELGTTEVILPDENGLWIARLNQARYWSQSQARLLARRIVWEHVDLLFGRSKTA